MTYGPKLYPMVASDVGIRDLLAITVVVLDGEDDPTADNVVPLANAAAYQAAYTISLDEEDDGYDDAVLALARHARFQDIVNHFTQYANPSSISAVGNVVTLGFEQAGLFSNGAIGRPGSFTQNGNPRENAYDLAASFVAANDHDVSTCTVTINGVSQSTTSA